MRKGFLYLSFLFLFFCGLFLGVVKTQATDCQGTIYCGHGIYTVCIPEGCNPADYWCTCEPECVGEASTACSNYNYDWCNDGACSVCASAGSCSWPVCDPVATTCGECSVSCGGGTRTCTDGCTSWPQTCNTQACCVNTSWAPATNTVCTDQPFTQTGSPCGDTRTAYGTLDIPQTCTGTSIEFVETPQNTGTIWVRALGVGVSATRVRFPTWSTVGGQDDIVWYEGVNLGGGTWQATINAATHAQGGFVNVNVYMDGCGTVNNQCFPNTGYTYAPKQCSVSSNMSVVGIGQTFRVTTTGNAHINAGGDTTRLWVSRNNFTAISNYATVLSPGTTMYDYNPLYIYNYGSLNRTSTNAASTSVTASMSIGSTGNYNFWCDLNADLNGNLVKCSGNPLCDFNGGASSCADWKNCSGTANSTGGDNAFVCVNPAGACVPACGQASTCGTCSSADNGTPPTPVQVYPLGTSTNPTIIPHLNTASLRWTANTDGLTDGYHYRIFNAANNAILAGTTVVGIGSTGGTFVGVGGTVYYWNVYAYNNTCLAYNPSVGSPISPNRYFRFNASPTFVNSPPGANLTLANSDHTLVRIENTGTGYSGNQICDSRFLGNRIVGIGVTATDPDGGGDIRTISINMGVMTATVNLGATNSSTISGTGVGYFGPVTVSAVSGTTRSVVFPIIFYDNYASTALNQLRVGVTDIANASSGWINSNRYLKVWNCQVPVVGTVYDSTSSLGGAVCPNTGFNVTAPAELGFTSLTYTSSVNKVMTVTQPATYSSGANSLIWGSTYLRDFGEINGTNQVMRAIDLGNIGLGATTCYTTLNVGRTNPYIVTPYSTTPSLRVDFSFLRNQEPWFQVAGAGIKSGVSITDNVPITYYLNSPALAAMSINYGESNNGLVAAPAIDNNSGCSDCSIGLPKNMNRESNLINDSYDYEYFYQEYFSKLGVGVTFNGNQTLQTILSNSNVGGTGLVFVNGNLTVGADQSLTLGGFLMVVVNGNITVAQNVNTMTGIFVADGSFITSLATSNNTQLVINGLVSANSGATLNRGFATVSNNNLNPGVLIRYKGDLLFTMPPRLSRGISEWKVTAN
ncbi:hypothetical protein A2574_02050 [Candidatus Shapirobacteria bacterium RIFOXYD1_FULL_38_32]|uniref:Uncharacterized protein n=3 Tax=Candidatus Shapironibacteriota TaxID=1752721 RepID=A0A0G0JT15_9BACT|nr:MAG: hypothetical protein US90_C0011G0010 [Candidatus Shapirobacteria bacterium GW2011_GWE2_38_30]OGL55953.1 MAG: hypothetical protein A2195_02260 [Candidatus Shapirobacteria bacterium RIFOXYA1_FULL_39_17]OGL56655.1 MAG: hypothetical protein A2367_02290 [Candidatus Shapirobacteria bacterium RIFOXYB1_FULL_38_38]OGL57877.1 MAG: hypothetical protein A2574_02050 [Candidatus Shapirobacteria bacterium RIFOXYD1_FULL_38_32]HAP37494.1 hypothetical protein [Candidatus Shapirobacteria bacterium]